MGTGRLVVPLWWFASLVICPRQFTFWTVLGFVGTLWFQALVLVSLWLLVGNCWGCEVAQMRSPPVSYIIPLSSLAQCVRYELLRGSTPRTPHSHGSIGAIWSGLLLSDLCRSWEVLVSWNTRGLPWCCLLSPLFCISLLVGSTANSSHGTTRLICWRGCSKLDIFHWYVAINGWFYNFMSI